METHCLKDCEKSIFECDSCALSVEMSKISMHNCKKELKSKLDKYIQENDLLKTKESAWLLKKANF